MILALPGTPVNLKKLHLINSSNFRDSKMTAEIQSAFMFLQYFNFLQNVVRYVRLFLRVEDS